MFMNTLSRTISGVVMILLGLFLISILFWSSPKDGGVWVALGYGVILIILGLFVLFNKSEDQIEQIKTMKGGKKK